MADQTSEERAGKTAEYVRLETSYLPKGMVQSEEGKYSFEDNYMQGGVSMIVYQLTPEKTIADIENTGIAVSEETSIGGRPAVYMETAPAEGDSAENSSTEGTANENTTGAKKIYMIYAEHNYLLEMFIFPDVTKEEAFQIARVFPLLRQKKRAERMLCRCAVGMTWKMRQEKENRKRMNRKH